MQDTQKSSYTFNGWLRLKTLCSALTQTEVNVARLKSEIEDNLQASQKAREKVLNCVSEHIWIQLARKFSSARKSSRVATRSSKPNGPLSAKSPRCGPCPWFWALRAEIWANELPDWSSFPGEMRNAWRKFRSSKESMFQHGLQNMVVLFLIHVYLMFQNSENGFCGLKLSLTWDDVNYCRKFRQFIPSVFLRLKYFFTSMFFILFKIVQCNVPTKSQIHPCHEAFSIISIHLPFAEDFSGIIKLFKIITI